MSEQADSLEEILDSILGKEERDTPEPSTSEDPPSSSEELSTTPRRPICRRRQIVAPPPAASSSSSSSSSEVDLEEKLFELYLSSKEKDLENATLAAEACRIQCLEARNFAEQLGCQVFQAPVHIIPTAFACERLYW